jgi:hypothetical protein
MMSITMVFSIMLIGCSSKATESKEEKKEPLQIQGKSRSTYSTHPTNNLFKTQ